MKISWDLNQLHPSWHTNCQNRILDIIPYLLNERAKLYSMNDTRYHNGDGYIWLFLWLTTWDSYHFLSLLLWFSNNLNLFIENTLCIMKQEKNVSLSITVLLVFISSAYTFHSETSVLWTFRQKHEGPKTNETHKKGRKQLMVNKYLPKSYRATFHSQIVDVFRCK